MKSDEQCISTFGYRKTHLVCSKGKRSQNQIHLPIMVIWRVFNVR
jgi:hypothetical protein